MAQSKVCRVEAVMVEENAVFVDAQHLTRPSIVFRNTPLMAGFSGLIAIPQVGQKVVVSEDATGYTYVEGILTGPDEPDSSLTEGDFALTFDSNTRFSIREDGNGGFNIKLSSSGDVSVEAQGGVSVSAQDNVLLDATGDATVKADGNILIGENGEPVARQNHTHDYEDTGDTGDGSAGTTSKTTPTPNESGTNTNIQ